jgi:hypothetical protein
MRISTPLLFLLAVGFSFGQNNPLGEGNHPGFHEAAIAFGYGTATDMKSLTGAIAADWKGKSKARVEGYIDGVVERRDKQQLGAMRHPGSVTLTFFAPGKGISTFSVTFDFDPGGFVEAAEGISTGH